MLIRPITIVDFPPTPGPDDEVDVTLDGGPTPGRKRTRYGSLPAEISVPYDLGKVHIYRRNAAKWPDSFDRSHHYE